MARLPGLGCDLVSYLATNADLNSVFDLAPDLSINSVPSLELNFAIDLALAPVQDPVPYLGPQLSSRGAPLALGFSHGPPSTVDLLLGSIPGRPFLVSLGFAFFPSPSFTGPIFATPSDGRSGPPTGPLPDPLPGYLLVVHHILGNGLLPRFRSLPFATIRSIP